MKGTQRAGMLRLMTSGMLVVLAAPLALAQGAGGGGAGPVTPPAVITTKDTVLGRTVVIRQFDPRIEALVTKLNGLPVGSAEFLATERALMAALAESKLAGAPGTTEFHVQLARPSMVVRLSPLDNLPQGWLGFTAAGVNEVSFTPTGHYLQYLEYPTVVAIDPDSPASRAGVRAGDSLLAYNGLDLRVNAVNMTQLLAPGREVSVRLRRDGAAREVQLVVEKASATVMAERRAGVMQIMSSRSAEVERRLVEESMRRRTPATGSVVARSSVSAGPLRAAGALSPTMRGLLGAAMADVDENFAKSIRGMEGKRGVMITSVPDGSPAARAGLRSGDVVLRVESDDVPSVPILAMRLQQAEFRGMEKITLTILREGKSRELTYSPRP